MSKQVIIDFLKNHYHNIEDVILMFLTVISGTYIKFQKQIKTGLKPSFHWFLAEGIMSFFVAISIYAIFDQFLHLNKLFTYVVCAWCGSLSSVFQDQFKDLLISVFDSLKAFFNRKLNP